MKRVRNVELPADLLQMSLQLGLLRSRGEHFLLEFLKPSMNTWMFSIKMLTLRTLYKMSLLIFIRNLTLVVSGDA